MNEESVKEEHATTPRTTKRPATMVMIVSAWTSEDGELQIRISRNIDGGLHRDTVWVQSAGDAGEAVRQAIAELAQD